MRKRIHACPRELLEGMRRLAYEATWQRSEGMASGKLWGRGKEEALYISIYKHTHTHINVCVTTQATTIATTMYWAFIICQAPSCCISSPSQEVKLRLSNTCLFYGSRESLYSQQAVEADFGFLFLWLQSPGSGPAGGTVLDSSMQVM